MKKLLTMIGVVLIAFAITKPVYAKDYICETVDGAYYGRSGEETDKATYEKECGSHSCELIGDSYIGVNGKEVSKETFESECGAIVYEEFPDTASDSATATLFIILGLAIVGGSLIIVKTVKEQ